MTETPFRKAVIAFFVYVLGMCAFCFILSGDLAAMWFTYLWKCSLIGLVLAIYIYFSLRRQEKNAEKISSRDN